MNRRNLTTAGLAVAAIVLLYSGISMAREPERAPVLGGVTVRDTQPLDDRGGDIRRLAQPSAPATDDAASPSPSTSADDRGGRGEQQPGNDRLAPTASPTASPDDHGGRVSGGSNDDGVASPAATTEPGDDDGVDAAPSATPRASAGAPALPAATAAPTASPDDHGHDGGGSTAATAAPAPPTASPDDHGHHGGGRP